MSVHVHRAIYVNWLLYSGNQRIAKQEIDSICSKYTKFERVASARLVSLRSYRVLLTDTLNFWGKECACVRAIWLPAIRLQFAAVSTLPSIMGYVLRHRCMQRALATMQLPRFRISCCILPRLLTELEPRNNAHAILIYIAERLTGAGAKETAIGRAGSYGRELTRRHQSTAVARQR